MALIWTATGLLGRSLMAETIENQETNHVDIEITASWARDRLSEFMDSHYEVLDHEVALRWLHTLQHGRLRELTLEVTNKVQGHAMDGRLPAAMVDRIMREQLRLGLLRALEKDLDDFLPTA